MSLQGRDAQTTWQVAELMLWFEGKENGEENLLSCKYSIKICVHPVVLSLFAGGSRIQSYVWTANIKGQRTRSSAVTPLSVKPTQDRLPGEFSGLVQGQIIPMFLQQAGWSRGTSKSRGGQPSFLGISHPILGQPLAFLRIHRDLASGYLMITTSCAFIYESD